MNIKEIPFARTLPSPGLTGGDLPDQEGHLYRAMRQRLYTSPDVRDVLALSWLPDVQRWLYFIRTPSAWTYPRYVIGTTDEQMQEPNWIFRCATPNTAWTEWEAYNYGEHV